MGADTSRLAAAAAGISGLDLALPSLPDIVDWLSDYPAVLVLLLITVTGETVVLAAVVVATQGVWSLTDVMLWCFAGTVASDAAWFRLAGAVDERWLAERAGPRRRRVLASLRGLTGERPWAALVFIKFLYGSRFLMLVYLATRRVPLRRFLAFDALGTVLWLAVLGIGSRLFARFFASASAWRLLDGIIAVVMAGLAISLAVKGV